MCLYFSYVPEFLLIFMHLFGFSEGICFCKWMALVILKKVNFFKYLEMSVNLIEYCKAIGVLKKRILCFVDKNEFFFITFLTKVSLK